MRLLIIGDLASTGFGTVTSDLGIELLALGLDVRFLSQNELGELPEPFASRTFVVNDQREGWITAEFSIGGIIDGTHWDDDWAADVVLVIQDFYGARLGMFMDKHSEDAFFQTPSFHYAPIEGTGLPPAWRKLWDVMTPIAMSDFGAVEIAKVTGTKPAVVYHGVDPSAFYSLTPETPAHIGNMTITDRASARASLRLPADALILLRTDRNMPRKDYPALLRAIAPVLESHPDALMLMHCRSSDEGGDIRDELSKYPLGVARRMLNTGVYDRFGVGMTREMLNVLYNAADLYVSNSPEGFGLTIAEALACGIPAVGLDYSAVPEVIGPAGLAVPVGHLYDNPYSHQWATVDEAAFGHAVARLLDNPKERLRRGRLGPRHVRDNFSWSHAASQMAAIFSESIERRTAA